MRIILLLICFQFTAASFVVTESVDSVSHYSVTSQKLSKSITLSSLFEKTEKEGEEREEDLWVELPGLRQFSFSWRVAVQTILRTDIISHHIQKPSLFRLHCTILI